MIPMRGAGRDYQLLEEARPNDWPHDNSYLNFCSQCGVQFAGPKRSPSCWSCAPASTKDWWQSKFENEQ